MGKFCGTMDEGAYPRNFSLPRSVAEITPLLTSMCLFAVDSCTMWDNLDV